MSRRLISLLLLTLSLLLPLTAAAWPFSEPLEQKTGYVPRTADNIGDQLDAQIMRILEPSGYARGSVSIACTVPVLLGDLRSTGPLARQMMEELSRYFVGKGYKVDELRKGSELVMIPDQGEFLLTRDTAKLLDRTVNTQIVLVGTYTVTDLSVRFNIRLLSTPGSEVIAMAAGTVPVTEEIAPLIADPVTPPLQPSVRTRLPR